MDLVFLGPPGAGKGTQAKRTSERLEVAHLSTGDLLRKAVAEWTELGVEAKGFMDRGQLVPDELVGRMIEAELGSAGCRAGFLLDGYPRNLAQARLLDDILERLRRSLDRVLLIDVPDQMIEERLTGRRSCSRPGCGAMYHVAHNRPKVDGVCDACGSALVVRDDDRSEVIRERLEVFHRETEPLLDYYRERKLLGEVDGTGGLDQVQAAIERELGAGGQGA